MTRPILCARCSLPIGARAELTTAFKTGITQPYHNECFAESLMVHKSFLLNHYPVNGLSGNLSVIISFAAVILLTPYVDVWLSVIFAVMAVITLIYRLLSYFIHEKPLPKTRELSSEGVK